jgi:alanine racemase
MFAVANIAEANELAQIVPEKKILIFSPVQGANPELAHALKSNYHLTILDMAGARALAEAAEQANLTGRVHLKVDTGMGRMGALPTVAHDLIKFISSQTQLRLEGLYTHFATADELDLSFAHEQLSCFKDLLSHAPKVPLIHSANSAAMFRMAESHFAMVRPGISTYGYWPSKEMAGLEVLEDLKPILRLESRIMLVKELPAGYTCGYGRTFQAQMPTRIGIVPIGYADGYRRSFSNKAVMLIGRSTVPVIGRVSMDQTIVDLTDQPQVKTGDVVTVISEKRDDPNSVEALASLAKTIPHEITCLLGRRIMRQAVASF